MMGAMDGCEHETRGSAVRDAVRVESAAIVWVGWRPEAGGRGSFHAPEAGIDR